MRETQELREQVTTLQRVCGLKNDDIEKEVNLRIAVCIYSSKNIFEKVKYRLLKNYVTLLTLFRLYVYVRMNFKQENAMILF